MEDDRLLEMSFELAKAHLTTTQVPTSDVPRLVGEIFNSLKALNESGSAREGVKKVGGVQPSQVEDLEPPIVNKDVSGPEFAGLDPWLAARVPRRLAKLLDPGSAIHPSVHEDHLVCLEDGARVKLLRAYLHKNHGMSLADYVDRWRLPENYPTAPRTYLEGKRAQAKATGLGVTLRGTRGPAKRNVDPKPPQIPRANSE